VAFSPQANCTDWVTATLWWNLVPTFADTGVWRGQRGGTPTAVYLNFLDRKLINSFRKKIIQFLLPMMIIQIFNIFAVARPIKLNSILLSEYELCYVHVILEAHDF
jgi:hypothetical protein